MMDKTVWWRATKFAIHTYWIQGKVLTYKKKLKNTVPHGESGILIKKESLKIITMWLQDLPNCTKFSFPNIKKKEAVLLKELFPFN